MKTIRVKTNEIQRAKEEAQNHISLKMWNYKNGITGSYDGFDTDEILEQYGY
tara:strand:- start:743 stop:898 length:156 start_codon:yes stop_codon:yes gene_type:complete